MKSTLPVSLPTVGVGIILPVPVGSANGTALPTRDEAAQGVRFYLGSGDSVSYTMILGSQNVPTSAPAAANVVTISGPGVLDEVFPAFVQVYVTATTGTPKMRWM